MQTEIGIEPQRLNEVTKQLGQVLADEFVLYVKTLNAHWNVKGANFHSKHLFFETQYKELAEIIDDVAERIRALGHFAPATLADFLALTHLSEQPQHGKDSLGFIEWLLDDHDAIIYSLRKYIVDMDGALKDVGTADFATGLIEKHEKMAWMLRAHLP